MMNYSRPARKSIRLKGYDYTSSGAYFVTICTKDRRHLLGTFVGADALVGPHIELTHYGRTVEKYINSIDQVYPDILVDSFTVMPNHIHFIVLLSGSPKAATPTKTGLPGIVNSLKGLASKQCGISLWQRGYYEHVVRGENDLREIREYIAHNPQKWETDKYF